jgi:predicted outer membrane repeat protein
MKSESHPTFFECSFEGNSAPAHGGGVLVYDYSDPTFTACWFTDNTANYGAGAAVYEDITPYFDACVFYDNTASYDGGAVHSSYGAVPTFSECVFAGNSAGESGGAMYFYDYSTPVLTRCSLYDNSAPTGGGIWCDDNFTLTNCIVALNTMGGAVYCDGDPPYPSCTDIYGNVGGDWTGCLTGLDEVDNNFSEDPLFCDAPNGDFTLDVASPCTGPNNPACGLVGAWDIGCDTPVRNSSWGEIKAMYKNHR